MVRARILKLLQEDVKDAQKRLQDSTEYFDLAIRNRQSPTTGDRQQRVRLAARSHKLAARDLTTAVSRLNRFIVEGFVPDLPKPEFLRKSERVASVISRKTA
jgi:hypothetical protein